MAEKAKTELERIYTIPLRKVKTSPRNHRTDRAVRAVKAYLSRHMKATDVWIDQAVNERLWARGMYRIPPRIRVRALKFDDGVVEVTLPEAEVSTSVRDRLKEEREGKAEKAEKKAEKKEEGKKEGEAEPPKPSAEEKEGPGAEKQPTAAAEKPEKAAAPERAEKPAANEPAEKPKAKPEKAPAAPKESSKPSSPEKE